MLKREGLDDAEARSRIFAVDKQGLLVEDDPELERPQWPYAQPRAVVAGWKLENEGKILLQDVIANAKPTVLVGLTAQRGLFSEKVLAEVAKNTERPVILALSNPTSKTECTPEEVAKATNGKGLIATGSPFAPVSWKGRSLAVSQCNNMYVFPGMGLGALVARALKVTDEMFLAASSALSAMVTPEQEALGRLLPDIKNIREVSFTVAMAVAKEARDSGLGRLLEDKELEKVIRKAQWEPTFNPYRRG
jgi:malate dehydrogenase (oxaloacetate-decarboxylating)